MYFKVMCFFFNGKISIFVKHFYKLLFYVGNYFSKVLHSDVNKILCTHIKDMDFIQDIQMFVDSSD